MYNTILFDLDGTLTDPGIGITNSVAYALKKHGIEVTDRTKLYPFIGPPLLDSFQRFYGFSEEQSEQAVADYREYFREKGLFERKREAADHCYLKAGGVCGEDFRTFWSGEVF